MIFDREEKAQRHISFGCRSFLKLRPKTSPPPITTPKASLFGFPNKQEHPFKKSSAHTSDIQHLCGPPLHFTTSGPSFTSYHHEMSRTMNSAPFLLSSVPEYCHQPRRSQLLSSHSPDTTSLLSSVILVVTMVFCAAFFIMTLGFLLANEHDSGEHSIQCINS